MGMITDIISNIGQSAKTLADKGLIKEGEYEFLFEGDHEFFSIPEKGLRLAFDASTQILGSVQLTLIKMTEDMQIYTGEMPPPFSRSMNKEQVRSLLGIPDKSSERKTIPGLGTVGGHDLYIDRLAEYPNLQVRALYSAEYKIRAIAFDAPPSV